MTLTQLDAELILMRWDTATEEDRSAAAAYGAAELGGALTQLEAEVPRVAEQVCSGSARMRDFPHIRGAYRVSEAVVSWRRMYPDLSAEWDVLGRRALAVMASLTALDAAGPWAPRVRDDGHPG
jgi:hypothetical protein